NGPLQSRSLPSSPKSGGSSTSANASWGRVLAVSPSSLPRPRCVAGRDCFHSALSGASSRCGRRSPPRRPPPLPLLHGVAISAGRHPRRQEPNRHLLAKNRRHLCHDKQQGRLPQLPPLLPPAATHHDHHQQRRPIQPPARTTVISPLESIGSTHCIASPKKLMDAETSIRWMLAAPCASQGAGSKKQVVQLQMDAEKKEKEEDKRILAIKRYKKIPFKS
ncbi:unnamed protein product, partial [Urochloa humidicola]